MVDRQKLENDLRKIADDIYLRDRQGLLAERGAIDLKLVAVEQTRERMLEGIPLLSDKLLATFQGNPDGMRAVMVYIGAVIGPGAVP